MPYFALFYDTVDNFVERRLPYRNAHLALVDDAHRRGRLLLAGALRPDSRPELADGPAALMRSPGALLVFHADDAAAVEAFAQRDPYVINGLVAGWRIHEWAVVVGDHAIPR